MFSKIQDLDYGKKVKVVFDDGQILIGIVDIWTSAEDSEDGLEELTIIPTKGELEGQLINFKENEVKSIEVVEEWIPSILKKTVGGIFIPINKHLGD